MTVGRFQAVVVLQGLKGWTLDVGRWTTTATARAGEVSTMEDGTGKASQEIKWAKGEREATTEDASQAAEIKRSTALGRS